MALYVDIPTPVQLGRLVEYREFPSMFTYLPTGRLKAEARVARTELKNLTEEPLERLRAAGEDARVVAELAGRLEDLDEDEEFWSYQADSLAVFVGPGNLRTFRLPNALEPIVVVSDRFHVKPLLRSVTFPQEGFVLALAEGSVRLLEFGPIGPPREVVLPDPPRDALDPRSNKVVRARPGTYVDRIDQALRPVLDGSALRLILAATETIAALYRTLNTYPHLAEERIAGNAETVSDVEVVDSARTLLDDIYAGELAEVVALFQIRTSRGRSATDLSDIARLATLGAIDTLLVDIDITVLGSIAEDTGAVTFDEAGATSDEAGLSHGVLDEAARRVLRNGGRVLAVRRGTSPTEPRRRPSCASPSEPTSGGPTGPVMSREPVTSWAACSSGWPTGAGGSWSWPRRSPDWRGTATSGPSTSCSGCCPFR